MIPLKVPCPQPIHRIGAVSAGGTHKGKNSFKIFFYVKFRQIFAQLRADNFNN